MTDYDRYATDSTAMKELDAIPREEGYLVEFKDFSGGLSNRELAATMCAFANTDGGDIYLGVTDSRRIKGLSVTPELLDTIQNAAREGCTPPVPMSLHRVRVSSSRSIIRVSIEKSGHLHSTTSGKTYIRVGTQDKKILGDELLRLAESKSQVSYEEKVLDAGVEVIDLDALNHYYEMRKNVSSIRKNLAPEELLMKMGFAERKDEDFRIKAGAFIVFGKEESTLLLQWDFTFVKYDTEGKMYSYREDISLPAARMLERLSELIRPYNKHTEGVEGLVRQDVFHYPEEAIREALLNAVAHRDYRLMGLRNECRLYPNRLEVISAGALPSVITLENIDKRHYSRNPKIMHALLMLGMTEELGQGITLMKGELARNGNPPPEFIASPDQFKVVFYKARRVRTDKEYKQSLDEYFQSNDVISRAQIESIVDIGTTKAKYLIQSLLKEGYLERVGKGPSTRYKKKGLA